MDSGGLAQEIVFGSCNRTLAVKSLFAFNSCTKVKRIAFSPTAIVRRMGLTSVDQSASGRNRRFHFLPRAARTFLSTGNELQAHFGPWLTFHWKPFVVCEDHTYMNGKISPDLIWLELCECPWIAPKRYLR
jgi:hypothetical protein